MSSEKIDISIIGEKEKDQLEGERHLDSRLATGRIRQYWVDRRLKRHSELDQTRSRGIRKV